MSLLKEVNFDLSLGINAKTMETIKRALVGLDMTEMDDYIIRYTSFLSDLLDLDKIYFFHVSPSLSIPKRLTEKYPDLLAPADESLVDLVEDKIKQFYKGRADVSIEIREGNARDKILRWSDIKEIDLIVLGKKNELKGSGLLPNHLAKIGHCSILMVPEGVKSTFEKIMVPVDFSNSSKSALKKAVAIAGKSKAQLLIQNTYVVPQGYHKSGKSYEEFAEIMRHNAEQDAVEYLNSMDLDASQFEVELSLDDDDEPSDKIYAVAENQHVDLIIIASKGRTGLANILLGSVADKLLQAKGKIPVLVIKNKKGNMGFLDALLRI